jgi:Rubisco LSMT substrate-binding
MSSDDPQTPMSLQLRSSDPLYDQKCNYWRGDGSLPGRRVRVSVCENENSRILFSLLRIIEADVEDFDRLTVTAAYSNQGIGTGRTGSRSYRSIQDAQVPISVRNEIRAMRLLKTICEDLLAGYPNSYEDDCLRLADDSSPRSLAPFSNERHALIQVKGEKEVLLFYKDFSRTAIRLLELKDDSCFNAEVAAVWPLKHVVVQQYLSNSLCRLRQDDKQRAELRQRNVDFSRPTVV